MTEHTEKELAAIKAKLAAAGLAPDERTEAELEADAAKITGAEAPS